MAKTTAKAPTRRRPARPEPDATAAPEVTDSLRERKKQKTAAAIYDAALALFAERGYDAVSVEDICEQAEVGRATFFRLYGTKIGLLAEFNRRVAALVRDRIRREEIESPSEQLRVQAEEIGLAWSSSGSGMISLAGEMLRSGLAGEVMTAGVGDDHIDIHDPLLALTAEALHAGARTGEFQFRGVSPRVLTYVFVMSLAASVADWLIEPRNRDVTQVVTDMVTLLLAAISGSGIK